MIGTVTNICTATPEYIQDANFRTLEKRVFEKHSVLYKRILIFYSGFTPISKYFSKLNNKKTKLMCKICFKLTIKTQWRPPRRHSGPVIVNFKHI